MYNSIHSLSSALDGGEWSTSCPGRFTPRERAPGIHWIGGWVGPGVGLDAVGKGKIPSPHRESNTKTPIVQPVAQHYTEVSYMLIKLNGEYMCMRKETITDCLRALPLCLPGDVEEAHLSKRVSPKSTRHTKYSVDSNGLIYELHEAESFLRS
jgi:hypothetical protein